MTIDNDDYESSGYNDTTGEKYAQLVVPEFPLAASGTFSSSASATSATTTGGSFLRLGSFPDVNDSTDYSATFGRSLRLARLVGDTSKFANSAGETYDKAADTDSTDNLGTIDGDNYRGDKNFLVGFVDDTRVQKSSATINIDGTDVSSATATRKTETKRLLFKGGWWEHTDGNRVTTTSGDKLEVIGGNYKLVVLGRQDPTNLDMDKVKVIDSSGGKTFSSTGGVGSDHPAFGKINERLNEDDVWATYAYESAKHTYKETHGVEVSKFIGSKRRLQYGEEGGETKNPHMIFKTWAQKVESYTGSAGTPVNHAFSLSFIEEKQDYAYGVQNYSWQYNLANNSSVMGVGTLDVKGGGAGFQAFYGLEQTNLLLQPQLLDVKLALLKTDFHFLTEVKLKLYSDVTKASDDEFKAAVLQLAASRFDVFFDRVEVAGGSSMELASFYGKIRKLGIAMYGQAYE